MTDPNLQQQPGDRDEYWRQICREDFIPYPDCWWGLADYSQIEYRFLAHFAVGEGSEELRAAYNADSSTDYHAYVMKLTGLPRKPSKNLSFGVIYGMGARGMAKRYGWDLDYSEEIIRVYHEHAPYVRATSQLVEKRAVQRGFIKTFLGRRAHLKDPNKVYTMLCRLLQGSAGDLIKKSMLECYNQGVFDILHPHITVHDELDVSVPKSKIGIEAYKELQRIMETSLKLRVPIKVKLEAGPSWADAKEFEWSDLEKDII